jgi:hypothetical protein
MKKKDEVSDVNQLAQLEKERTIGLEVMRLLTLEREGTTDLIDAALSGREKSVESVGRMYQFVRRNFGPGPTTDKYWSACVSFFKQQELTTEQIEELRAEPPAPGDKNFRSILDEMRDEGIS